MKLKIQIIFIFAIFHLVELKLVRGIHILVTDIAEMLLARVTSWARCHLLHTYLRIHKLQIIYA